ncbi:MAG: Hsp20/alpha crystallin family protein, partial [Phycisphaerae bacterium]|nr:Hsp20/alpha crystallin family protein [Phycisphaerae bacterium]
MNLVRWKRHTEPTHSLPGLREELDRLFDHFRWGDFDGLVAPEWQPAVDVAETDTDLVVKVEAPGLEPKDIDISIRDGILTIQGEKKEEAEEKGLNWRRVERRYGSFVRNIALPDVANTEKVEATAKDGVLTIRLPKEADKKTKR